MNKFKELKLLNQIKLDISKEHCQDYTKYKIINDIFEDEACFFKISKEDAFMILNYLDIKDNKKEEVYFQLISPDYYYYLYNNIDINDKDLVIKYKIYNNNVFN